MLQILIDGTDPTAVDDEGQPLPTLAYLAREKRPQYHHNFKAGAMNALVVLPSTRITLYALALICILTDYHFENFQLFHQYVSKIGYLHFYEGRVGIR